MITIFCKAEGADRKRLANILGEFLSTKPIYTKAPTYAYQLGDYTVTRDSQVVCPESVELEDIIALLADAGFEPTVEDDDVQTVETTTEAEITSSDSAEEAIEATPDAENPAPDVAPEIAPESPEVSAPEAEAEEPEKAAETAADAPDVAKENPEAPQPVEDNSAQEEKSEVVTEQSQEAPAPAKDLDPNRLTISIPKDKFPNGALSRLQTLVSNKEPLFKRSLQAESLPIEVDDEKVSFPWFTLTGVEGEAMAYAQFITCLCKMAKEQSRIQDKPYDGDNDRFAMRIFMVRLGMKGVDFALARKLMMKNLTGNSGWRYGDPNRKPTTEKEAADPVTLADVIISIPGGQPSTATPEPVPEVVPTEAAESPKEDTVHETEVDA